MSDEEKPKEIKSHDVAIALIQNDIKHIADSILKIETKFDGFDRTFARKEELKDIEKNVDSIHRDIKVELAKKVDHTDFDPIKKTLSRINWVMILGVVVALLSLVYKQ